MSLLLQDIFVTAISVGAAATLLARVFGIIRPQRRQGGCDKCSTCSPPAPKAR